MNQSRSEVIEKQTVIYVLSESFADPRRIDGVSVSEIRFQILKELKIT